MELAEDVDGRGRDEVPHALEETVVRAHERALLELRESDVLRRVGRVQLEGECQLPRPAPKDGVTE